MATLSLFLRDRTSVTIKDLHKAVAHLKRGVRALQLRCQMAKMHEGLYEPEPFAVDVGKWLRSHAPSEAVVHCCAGHYELLIGQALPELAMSLSFGNCLAHGAGGIETSCSFSYGELRIEISNRTGGGASHAGSSLNQYSTGLGLKDLHGLCKAMGIKYQSLASNDGLYWHSTIYLPARHIPASEVAGTAAADRLPERVRVAVVDDQKMIPRLVKYKIEKQCKSAVVEYFVLDTTERYEAFVEETLPGSCRQWDLVILDQHMPMTDQPATVRRGTDLISLLKQHDFDGCTVMHTGNSTAGEIATYKAAGAHGSIGKGTENFVDELCRIYSRFMGTAIPDLSELQE